VQKPIQITIHGLSLSEGRKERIRQKAEKLGHYDPRLTSCRVTCEQSHRHKRNGNEYNVRIELGVPGSTLVITREPRGDFDVALRDAFDAARRQLEDAVRKRDGRTKQHENALEPGKVTRLIPDLHCGFIRAADGHEVYFHYHSVLHGGVDRLKQGSKVLFAEEMGEKGAQARLVRISS
jgi:cold shock CspA family protein